jgi:uncharacterized membrane protein YdjX (TVP38/TMEM64 family)
MPFSGLNGARFAVSVSADCSPPTTLTRAMHYLVHLLHWMQEIQHAGWKGYLMFIVLYAVCCIFFIPASFLTFAAGAVWGFWGGTALVLIGNGLGSLLCLLITRYMFRGLAAKVFRRYKKLETIAGAVEHDGWKMVLLTRLSPIMPFSLINYALGLTKLSAWHFLVATEVGSIPAIAVYVYLGTVMGNLAKIRSDLHHGVWYWTIQGVGLFMAVFVTVYVTRMASRSLKQRIKE